MATAAPNVLVDTTSRMSNDWKNEDDIKAELRVLTDELRTLRHELRNMVAPPKPHHPSRAFLHRQSWPGTPPAAPHAANAPPDGEKKGMPDRNSKKKR
jgi:hypothetical protein